MKVAKTLKKGKYYQFIGFPILIIPEDKETWGGTFSCFATCDPFINSLMDREPRKVLESLDGETVIFEDIYIKFLDEKIPWPVYRGYETYLKAGMFVEVEVEK